MTDTEAVRAVFEAYLGQDREVIHTFFTVPDSQVVDIQVLFGGRG